MSSSTPFAEFVCVALDPNGNWSRLFHRDLGHARSVIPGDQLDEESGLGVVAGDGQRAGTRLASEDQFRPPLPS